MKPTILAFTPGEPAGIGPDLAVMIAQKNHSCCIVAIADPELLTHRADQLKLALKIKEFDESPSIAGELQVISVASKNKTQPGIPDIANANYVLETLKIAINGCLNNNFDALVTGPIQKSIINDAGIAFTGHTEYLSQICGVKKPVMMLANENLKVALVTTHIPLSKVSQTITQDIVERVITIVNSDLDRYFGILNPRIVICGLNPHAGEGGHLGEEEVNFITPVITRLKKKGFNLSGPLPADTAFTSKIRDDADVLIAMYHDQGLPVIKALGFGETVNITLGLPMIRTSVDHGTALSLSGTGNIDTGSLMAALNMAIKMVNHVHHR